MAKKNLPAQTAAASAPSTDPFAQLWADIVTEANKVKDELISLGKQLETAVVADIRAVFAQGAPLAVAAIIAEAPKLISGEEKFGNAVASVAEQLQVNLGPIAIQDVQTLVQAAFRGIQSVATSK